MSITNQPLQLYNSFTRRKEVFKPIEPKKLQMYACGMTVYDMCHIGHGRTFVSFDVMVRFLRGIGWDVNFVRNITDIDDNILNRAKQRKVPFETITETYINEMHQDFDALYMLRPDSEPRATEHISHIIDMINTLIEKQHAYQADNGDVYFKVASFDDYGKLSGKNLDELLDGVRIDVQEAKLDSRDFALWKSASAEDVGWDSPWGRGRPGWHIECSAMTKSSLGMNFDIHAGGSDLIFPHHENEIAQSECANDCRFANYWLHTGALRVNGEKMSKSLNNFFTIRDVLAKYHPEIIRFFIVNTHYRSAISYSEETLQEAKIGIDRFYYCLQQFSDVEPASIEQLEQSDYFQKFVSSMLDDFNTREAISVLYSLVREINRDGSEKVKLVTELKALAKMLGILQTDANDYLQSAQADQGDEQSLSAEAIEALIKQRTDAKQNKDYQLADEIRQQLLAQNVQIEDSHEGVRWRRTS